MKGVGSGKCTKPIARKRKDSERKGSSITGRVNENEKLCKGVRYVELQPVPREQRCAFRK